MGVKMSEPNANVFCSLSHPKVLKNKTNPEIETNDRCGVIVFLWSKNGNPSPNPTIELITAVLTSMIFSQDYSTRGAAV